ncbi:MAG: VOC family protein [Acidobacteriia bacterium]|nr:VOC family protein [Terriglobia bacterium]
MGYKELILREAFRRGAIGRRQLIRALGAAATGAWAASAAPKAAAFAASAAQIGSIGGTGFRAVAYNHINYQVADYAKIRDFYIHLFGMKCVWDDGKQCSLEFGDPPNAIYLRPLRQPPDRPAGAGANANWAEQMGSGSVDHLAFSIDNFQLDSVKAELSRRGLNPSPDGPFAWSVKDPSGLIVQICATRGVFPGQAAPTAKESDGLQHLDAIPKPDGSIFKAVAVNHLLLMVPDVDKCRDFYADVLGMKVIYYKPGDMFGVDSSSGPACFLKFGESVLYLRKSLHPEHKPYVAHFAVTVENYDQAAVKAELMRRGFQPVADTKYGWIIKDPAGMRLEVAGKGMPEHVAGDCNGTSQQCPGGPDK